MVQKTHHDNLSLWLFLGFNWELFSQKHSYQSLKQTCLKCSSGPKSSSAHLASLPPVSYISLGFFFKYLRVTFRYIWQEAHMSSYIGETREGGEAITWYWRGRSFWNQLMNQLVNSSTIYWILATQLGAGNLKVNKIFTSLRCLPKSFLLKEACSQAPHLSRTPLLLWSLAVLFFFIVLISTWHCTIDSIFLCFIRAWSLSLLYIFLVP